MGYSPWGGKESDTTSLSRLMGLPRRLRGGESACQAGNIGWIPGSGERNGNPLVFLPWKSMDRGAGRGGSNMI